LETRNQKPEARSWKPEAGNQIVFCYKLI